jgi:UDP-N-acetylmuramate--alanine ligase
LLKLVTNENKKLLSTVEILKRIEDEEIEILVTMGAGNIDQLVKPIKERIEQLWS